MIQCDHSSWQPEPRRVEPKTEADWSHATAHCNQNNRPFVFREPSKVIWVKFTIVRFIQARGQPVLEHTIWLMIIWYDSNDNKIICNNLPWLSTLERGMNTYSKNDFVFRGLRSQGLLSCFLGGFLTNTQNSHTASYRLAKCISNKLKRKWIHDLLHKTCFSLFSSANL